MSPTIKRVSRVPRAASAMGTTTDPIATDVIAKPHNTPSTLDRTSCGQLR